MIPQFSITVVVLAIAAIFSSLIVSYALLRVDSRRPDLVMFLVSVLVFIASVMIVFDDVVAPYRDELQNVELIPSAAAVIWLFVALGFVGYTARELLT